jgi:uridine kinase
MKNFFKEPFFYLGLLIRISLIFIVIPKISSQLYIPFLDVTSSNLTFNPWEYFIDQGGNPIAFPYGIAMWLTFLPGILSAKYFNFSTQYGYQLTLLLADLFLLYVFSKIYLKTRLLSLIYWCSPIVIFATYWLGLNDLIPILFLTSALYFLRQLKFLQAGIFSAIAVSAKFSMILAIPFFVIYFIRNRSLTQHSKIYLLGFIVALILLFLPLTFSSAAFLMLLNNPEMGKSFDLVLSIGEHNLIFIVPLLYVIILYSVWRVHRVNFDLFLSMLGMAFMLIILFTQASYGWFIWLIPLFIAYQMTSGRTAILLIFLFSTLYVLSGLSNLPLPNFSFSIPTNYYLIEVFSGLKSYVAPILSTLIMATGLILSLRIMRESISKNDFFRLSRKPFVIGIAGDSGSGKDTLVDSLESLFGNHSVTKISGDDYHLYDRKKPVWKLVTHLNPMANNLEKFTHDLADLANNKNILARNYNHETGKLSHPIKIKSNDIIISSGLHALFFPELRDLYNLSIYLDIDESLRRYFKFKRDLNKRNQGLANISKSLAKREVDSSKFIRPQAMFADLIFSLKPAASHLLKVKKDKKLPPLKLVVRSPYGLNESTITHTLISLSSLKIDRDIKSGSNGFELTIEGDISSEDIAMLVKKVCPRILEFLDIKPKWNDGYLGLMQFFTLSHINQSLNKRLL